METGDRDPRIISLDEAITQIRQACEEYRYLMDMAQPAEPAPLPADAAPALAEEGKVAPVIPESSQNGTQPRAAKEKTGRRPFFFLVGAGLSYPDVPLSSDITKQCKLYAQRFNITSEPANSAALDTYSHWFDQAYPHPKQRQIYLRSLIENKPISVANFRLAHLLASKKIANVVVTLNFDDFISRALTLFGRPHIVCDHPATVERINPEQDDIQILHVHGTYWFYDCVNLRAEIAERALVSDQTNATMAYKLDDILERSSPIVIGYSGWEDDVVMRSLKRRLSTTLPYNIYWFCYQRENLQDLPKWLKEKRQVCFIVPQVDGADSLPADTKLGQKRETSTGIGSLKEAQSKTEGPTLKAQIVLETMQRAFAIDPPELTQDPLSFFAGQLSSVLPKNPDGQVIDHGYSLRNIIEYALDLSKEHPLPDSQFKKALDALQSSRNREAINEALKIPLNKLSEAQLRDLVDAMWAAAVGLFDNSDDELSGYDLIVQASEILIKRNIVETGILTRIADALNNKALTLSARGRHADAVKAYESVARKLDSANDAALLVYVADAMMNSATMLRQMDKNDEAFKRIDQIVDRFGSSTDPAIRQTVAASLNNKMVFLFELDRFEEAFAAANDLVTRFGEARDESIAGFLAGAFNGIGFYCLDKAKQSWADKEAAKSLLEKAREQLALSLQKEPENPTTLGNLAYAAFLLGNTTEALEVMTKAIEKGGEEQRKIEAEDAARHAIPEDSEFLKMLNSIPLAETPSPA